MKFLESILKIFKKPDLLEKQTSLNLKNNQQITGDGGKPKILEVKNLEIIEKQPPESGEILESYTPKK